MSNVIVKEGESLDSALRRFKRNCAKAGIQQEIRKREHYEKPSVKRKKQIQPNLVKFCLKNKTKPLRPLPHHLPQTFMGSKYYHQTSKT